MLTNQLHIACNGSNEDGGKTGHVTGTASPWLRIKMFLGPVLCGLAKRSHWGNLFQYYFHLTQAATTEELLSTGKFHFWEASLETGRKGISDPLRSSDVWKGMHERFYSNYWSVRSIPNISKSLKRRILSTQNFSIQFGCLTSILISMYQMAQSPRGMELCGCDEDSCRFQLQSQTNFLWSLMQNIDFKASLKVLLIHRGMTVYI